MPVTFQKNPDICLLLITDDDESHINLTIASVSKFINHYVLLDMSTRIYTQRTAKECIPTTSSLEIYEYPYSRASMEDLQDYGLELCRGKAKWTLILYGNEYLASTCDFSWLNDTPIDLMYIHMLTNPDESYELRLFRNDIKGVVPLFGTLSNVNYGIMGIGVGVQQEISV